MTVLEAIDDGLWVTTTAQTFLGLRVGTRMTVVRLASGGLWVHSPVMLTDALRGELDQLGPVEHIVGPNFYHHLRLGEYVEAYPSAKLHGAPGLADKRQDLSFDSTLADGSAPWGDELEALHIGGTMLRETVFVHAGTRSLIASDLLENFETSDHFPTRMYLKISGVHGKAGVGWPIRLMHRKRQLAREGLDRVLCRELERIVICHGDIIESDGRAVLRDAYAWLR